MGLPLWKPRETEEDEPHQWSSGKIKSFNDFFQPSSRHRSRAASPFVRRHQLPSPSASVSTTSLSGISAPFQPRQRQTISATTRRNLVASASMERRHSVRPNHSPTVEDREGLTRLAATDLRAAYERIVDQRLIETERQRAAMELRQAVRPSPSLPRRSGFGLEERVEQRLFYKGDLLQQLRATIALLDQFILAGAAWGSETVALPSFILSALPDVIESACSLADATTNILSTPTTPEPATTEERRNSVTMEVMINRLLQMPPYLTLNQTIDNNILAAHRRIREQLAQFADIGFSNSSSAGQQNSNTNVDAQ